MIEQDFVYALAPSPEFERDGICFAARLSGLYRSEDGGETWHPAYDALNLNAPLATTSVVVSPNFAADRNVFAGVHGAVLRSADGGETWHTAGLGTPPPSISALVISPDFVRDGVLMAGSLEDGIFRSSDRGHLWEAWNFGLLDLHVLCMAVSPTFADDDTLFVGVETGVFRSTNGGRAWRETDFSMAFAPVVSMALGADGTLYAGTESKGLYGSDDGGQTWSRLGAEKLTGAVEAVVTAGEGEVLVLHEGMLYFSQDSGASWTRWHARENVAAVAAPRGLGEGAPLLVGLVGGDVKRL